MSLNMKCVCGYEYYRYIFNLDDKKNEGDKQFERIKGSYYIHDDSCDYDERRVFLYACPKCGTVQMSKY